jgi:major type 1 subunit fimbrin (pilin)
MIPLPPVGARTLNESGHGPIVTNFQIALTGCPVGIGVRARFDVTDFVDTETGMLKNGYSGANPAKNAELALLDQDGNKIFVGEPQTDAPVITDNSGKATLNYGVQYYAVGTVEAGTMDTTASYTMEYL